MNGPDYPGIRITDGKFRGIGNIQKLSLKTKVKLIKADNNNNNNNNNSNVNTKDTENLQVQRSGDRGHQDVESED